MRNFVLRFYSWAKVHFKKNWGAPFVLGFMVLLVIAAAFLAAGSEWWANEVANYAYFALVAGVVLQLVCLLKYGEREGCEN
jgi:formate-dependent nitrite reductase membrane component NrfD